MKEFFVMVTPHIIPAPKTLVTFILWNPAEARAVQVAALRTPKATGYTPDSVAGSSSTPITLKHTPHTEEDVHCFILQELL